MAQRDLKSESSAVSPQLSLQLSSAVSVKCLIGQKFERALIET